MQVNVFGPIGDYLYPALGLDQWSNGFRFPAVVTFEKPFQRFRCACFVIGGQSEGEPNSEAFNARAVIGLIAEEGTDDLRLACPQDLRRCSDAAMVDDAQGLREKQAVSRPGTDVFFRANDRSQPGRVFLAREKNRAETQSARGHRADPSFLRPDGHPRAGYGRLGRRPLQRPPSRRHKYSQETADRFHQG